MFHKEATHYIKVINLKRDPEHCFKLSKMPKKNILTPLELVQLRYQP